MRARSQRGLQCARFGGTVAREPRKKGLGLRALWRGQCDPSYCPRRALRSIHEGRFVAHETFGLPERLGDFVRRRHHTGAGDRGTELGTSVPVP